jgi:hypothetical protein
MIRVQFRARRLMDVHVVHDLSAAAMYEAELLLG